MTTAGRSASDDGLIFTQPSSLNIAKKQPQLSDSVSYLHRNGACGDCQEIGPVAAYCHYNCVDFARLRRLDESIRNMPIVHDGATVMIVGPDV